MIKINIFISVVDHQFDADQDADPDFHVDEDPQADLTISLHMMENKGKKITFIHSIVS